VPQGDRCCTHRGKASIASPDPHARGFRFEGEDLAAICLAATVIYGVAQLRPSLSFLYRLARVIVPDLIPEIG